MLLGGGLLTAGALVASLTARDPQRGTVIAPDVAADGHTDDGPAIQRALDAAPGDKPCTVFLRGLCYVGAAGVSGGAPFGLVLRKSMVTLAGSDGAGLVSDVEGIRLLVVTGVPGTAGDPLARDAWITSARVLPFSRPVDEGSDAIHLDGVDRSLGPGDLVFLRTGQLTDARLAREPDSELNEVAAVSRGQVTLRFPTAKPYLPERVRSEGNAITSPDGEGRQAPWGLSRATGCVVRDVAVLGLRLIVRSTGGTSTALRLQQAWGVTVSDCSIIFGKYGISGRYARDVRITRTHLHTLGADSDRDPAWIAPSTGCTDWSVESCRGGGLVPGKLHAHEGVADLRFTDWRSRTPDGPGQVGAENVSVRGRAYRQVYEVDMEGAYSEAGCAMARITSEVSGPPDQVLFRELRLRGDPGSAYISVQTSAVTIVARNLDLPPDAPVELLNGARPFS